MLRIRLETSNHVHLVLAPRTAEGVGRALGKAHRRYAAFVNARPQRSRPNVHAGAARRAGLR